MHQGSLLVLADQLGPSLLFLLVFHVLPGVKVIVIIIIIFLSSQEVLQHYSDQRGLTLGPI